MPTISVILTSYNHEKYLREAIDSVLCQTFSDIELIIIENGSTDRSWDIVRSYNDSRIISVRIERNIFPTAAFAQVLLWAKGKYVAIHCSDDIWEPDKLEKQIEFMEAHPEYAACFTWVQYINENSARYDPPEGGFYVNGLFDQPNRSRLEWLRYFFMNGNCLCYPSVLIKRKVFDEIELINIGFAQLPDFLMWIRLCTYGEIYILPERLTKFRLRANEQNTSGDRFDSRIRSTTEYYLLLSEYLRITDPMSFLTVFPEASQYFVKGEFLIEYALARMCLEEGRPACAKLFGLELLFAIVNSPAQAAFAAKLYGFTHLDFIKETGKHDIFGSVPPNHMQNASVFADCGGGFNVDVSENRIMYFPASGSFSLHFDLASLRKKGGGEIRALRFDPHEGCFIKCALQSVEIDGKSCDCIPHNSIRQDGEFDVFLTLDPMYMLEGNISGNILTIRGNLQILEADKSSSIIADILNEFKTKFALNDAQLAEKEKAIFLLRNQIQKINTSRAYRLAIFFRIIRFWIIPVGSRREKFGKRIIKYFSKMITSLIKKNYNSLKSVRVLKQIGQYVYKDGITSLLTSLEEKYDSIPINIPSRIESSKQLLNNLQKHLINDEYIISISHDNYTDNIGGVQVRISDEQMATNSIGISYLHLYPNTLKPTLARQNEPFYIGVNCDGMNIGISDGDGLLIALKQLESKRLRDVYIHHAMGFDIRLLYRILSELGNKKGRFWLHDYFSLCPGYNLLSNNRRYCGAPDMDSNACLICIYGETRRKQQPAFIKLFKDYQLELVAPSSYTLALWKEKFPVSMASEKVIPHAKIKWVGTIPARKIDDPLRIGFVGYPVYHKGWETWLRLVNQFSDDDRYRFFHFSNTPGTPGNYKRVNVAVTKDKRLSMVEALKDNQIDIAFLWSPWPETFSFTLHESLAAGCYILTYKDSGNIQNYLKQNVNRGLVLEDEQALFKLFSGNDLNSIVADYQQNGRPQAELIFLSELE